MSFKNKKWIEIGKIIAENPDANVSCPECEQNNLKIQDVMNENNHLELERIMYCSNCGAKNIIRLKQ